MKIALIYPYLPPIIDGVGEYTVFLAEALRGQGAEVVILCKEGGSETSVTVLNRFSRGLLSEIGPDLKRFAPDWCLLQYVPQVYGSHGFCPKIPKLLRNIRCSLGIKTAVTFHEFQSALSIHPAKFTVSCLLRWQTRQILNQCDAYTTTCRVYQEILDFKHPGIPSAVIPVGATIPSLAQESKSVLRKQKGLSENEIIFTFFGRLSTFRNPFCALKVLDAALRQGISARLLLLGNIRLSEPQMFAQLMNEAARLNLTNRLIITGALSVRAISEYLRSSDVFLFPQTDGISTRNTTLMSAAAHGLPIIGFEPSPGNFDGYQLPGAVLAPRGDEAAFIKMALHFASHPTDSFGMRSQIDYYQAQFDWSQTATRLLRLLDL